MSHTPPRNARTDAAARRVFKFGCLPALALVVLIIIIGSLADNDGDDPADAKASPTPATSKSSPATPGLDKRQITEVTVDMVWDSYSETRRNLLCAGIEVNGPDWFADQMQSDNIDPDYAAELVSEKCESR
ncbi:hypothetical protein KBZ00_25970 [Streptomyces sp. RK31]|uniref:hypothetical protein n=1 Tax=Streptomyces sp. RK31 TaxID=2824892 RepID=UPI001B373C00|nr:hypothetical protein [Streptomyces sp. RK31]MBQ0974548.1 hypothetical protein [Streptomyces sp. RK31]